MKLTIAAEIVPPTVGGPATYAAGLAAELQRRNIDVRVVSYSPVVRAPDSAWHLIHLHGGKTQRALSYIAALMSPPLPSVVLALGAVASGLPALLACRRIGIPLVVRCPGDYAWEVAHREGLNATIDTYAQCLLSKRIQLIRGIQARVLSGATKIIMPCSYLAAHLSPFCRSDRVTVVPNAPFVLNTPEQQAPSNTRSPHFLYVGRFVKHKGIGTIIRAFREMASLVQDVRLTLVGDGPQREEIVEQIKTFRLEGRASVVGPLDRVATLEYMSRALAVILNSSYECCTNVAVEALAVGTPVISTDFAGNREVLTTQTALLYGRDNHADLLQQMLKLYTDKKLFTVLSNNGIRQSARYTFGDMVDATISVLEEAQSLY